jgi:hypothetical protein
LFEVAALAETSPDKEDEEVGGVSALVEVETGEGAIEAAGEGVGVVDDLAVGLFKAEGSEGQQDEGYDPGMH